MQGGGATTAQPSMARMIKANNIRSDNDDDSDKTPNRSNSSGVGHTNGGGVSMAYPSGARQPALNNVANLFYSGFISVGALVEHMLGDESPSSSGGSGGGTVGGADGGAGGADNDDGYRGGKEDRKVPCYCLPCLSFGRGERGRSNVRALATLFFPMFLLCFFLLDDIGHTIMRNIRLRNGAKGLRNASKDAGGLIHPVLRRKTINEFPGIRRELMWVPLELAMNIEGVDASVEATMKCPRGILFLFHGCSRYAASFFYSPQGRKLVSAAYRAGVAIVAFEKSDEMGCWDWDADGEATLKIGRKFVASRLLGACGKNPEGETIYPPIWGFGASSGGNFVANLAARMGEDPEKYSPFLFSAINVQIMSPPESLEWNTPTIFTVMENDAQTKERVQERVSKKFQGGPFKMITTSGRKPIHPNHFARVYPDDKQMTEALSTDIYLDLVAMGIVDSSDGDMLSSDPRQSGDAVASIWEKYDMGVRAAARPGADEATLPFGVSNQLMRPLRKAELLDANSIWLVEELNVAWDRHEITAEGFDEVLNFLFQFDRP